MIIADYPPVFTSQTVVARHEMALLMAPMGLSLAVRLGWREFGV
jgi:hypothetical protein